MPGLTQEKGSGEQATDVEDGEPPSSDLTQLMPLNDANVLRAIRHQYLTRKDPYLHAGGLLFLRLQHFLLCLTTAPITHSSPPLSPSFFPSPSPSLSAPS